jgi:replication factor C small subunit
MRRLKITSVKKLEEKKQVYDITVSKNHNFFIGQSEILTHNCTHMLEASQIVLLNMMETYSLNTRFILTGNYPERLIAPLKSRCQNFDLKPPTKKDVALYLTDILNKEQITYENTDVAEIINIYYPDIRKVVNTAQSCVQKNKLVLNKKTLKDVQYLYDILNILKKPSNKSFNEIRQLIADEGVNDFDSIFRFLFDKLDEWAPNSPESMVLLGEYQYKSVTVPDKEISFMAFIANLINNK